MIFRGNVVVWLVSAVIFIISGTVDGTSGSPLDGKKIFMESTPTAIPRDDLVKTASAAPEHVHEVVFAVKQLNMDKVEAHLLAVSDPASPRYGQHMTREEVDTMTGNPAGLQAVLDELQAVPGATVVKQTRNGEYVVASATVGVWEAYFDTTFHVFEQSRVSEEDEAVVTKRTVVRCEQYSLPASLHPHVFAVLNTVQMPMVRGYLSNKRVPFDMTLLAPPTIDGTAQKSVAKGASGATGPYTGYVPSDPNCGMNGTITPCRLRQVYNIRGSGSVDATQSVFASLGSKFSPADLKKFQDSMGGSDTMARMVGANANDDTYCRVNANAGACAESMLDSEYLMAVCPNSPTTFWYVDAQAGVHDMFVMWLMAVADAAQIPLVLSVSYGGPEAFITAGELNLFSTNAMKLGLLGVTIVVSSGDDGAPSFWVQGHPEKCSYLPEFPASNPYVVAVGATQGLEIDGKRERTCQSDNGYLITSGGGFSQHYPTPDWQKDTVNAYLALADAKKPFAVPTMSPTSRANDDAVRIGQTFRRDGRGFPDVSAAGFGYVIVAGGFTYSVAGTSASTPVIAGMISLVNAKRIASGYPSLGFVNPALYAADPAAIGYHDVVDGKNNCVQAAKATAGSPPPPPVCCVQGFYGTPGWDPVTGFGSIDFDKFSDYFMSLVAGKTHSPSKAPAKSPTWRPSRRPTNKPTRKPTKKPAKKPNTTPVKKPSATNPAVKPALKKPVAKPQA
jgi:tripeptidyl-peptidase-1